MPRTGTPLSRSSKLRRLAADTADIFQLPQARRPAHAVSNENGLLDLEFSAEPCKGVGELCHCVFLQQGIAGAVSRKIRGYHTVIPAAVIDLG
jgi:hypothetical protein